jgi:predicted anti-sigma-YlaC factor YlaD
MSIVPDNDGHVRTALGLYLLGGLDSADEAAVERHLARCESCLDEYDAHSDIPSYLDSLDEEGPQPVQTPAPGSGSPGKRSHNAAGPV